MVLSLKKKYSQNFTVKQLISFGKRFEANELVVEFGSGTGNLTKQILKRNPRKVFGLEIDSRFADNLNVIGHKYENFDYILGDCTKTQELVVRKIESLGINPDQTIHITGNLPFNIAGQLLADWNKQSLLRTGLFSLCNQVKMTLMFSEDMGKRFLPDFSKRTRFSTITQTAFDVSPVDVYNRKCFNPQPASNVICLGFLSRKKRLFLNEQDLENYTTFLNKIYTLPNKQILRAAINGYKAKGVDNRYILECLEKLEIIPTERVFATPIHKLLALSRLLEIGQKMDTTS